MTTMNMIYREKGKPLTTKTLSEEMHLQYRLSGGKSPKGDKDSDKEDKVALTAAGKNGGKSEGKKKGENPNANKKCNHCEKKGHVEADCWKKFPDKIPENVKAARKKAEEKKSVAAAAVEDEVIFGAIDEDLIPSIAVKFETENNHVTTKDDEYDSDGKYDDLPELVLCDGDEKFEDGKTNDSYLRCKGVRRKLSLCRSAKNGCTTNLRSQTGQMTPMCARVCCNDNVPDDSDARVGFTLDRRYGCNRACDQNLQQTVYTSVNPL